MTQAPAGSSGLAIFGGSFDPIHLGHLDLARSLATRFRFEKVYFVPAKRNPLKGETSAPPAARLRMVELALEELGEPRFAALDWEIASAAPSYTVLTVDRLLGEGKPVTILMGNEVFSSLERWHEPARLLSLANIVVVERASALAIDVPAVLSRVGITGVERENGNKVWHSGRTRWIERVPFAALPLSATGLRRAIAEALSQGGQPVMPQGIQRSVWLFIKENRLYSVKR